MLSVAIASLAYLLLAIVGILDKKIVDNKNNQLSVVVFYSTIFLLPLLLLVPFKTQFLVGWDWLLALLSGFAFALGLWTMYIGYQKSEISHSGPLVGAIVAAFTVLFSFLFLKEILSTNQLTGIIFLLFGSILISFEQTKNFNGLTRGLKWMVLAGLLFSFSHVSSKYLYNNYGFYSGFVWAKGSIGIFGMLLLFLKPVRQVLFPNVSCWNKIRGVFKPKAQRLPILLIVDKVLGGIGEILIQYAIALGSVAIVNALAGLQYALLLVMVFILSKFWSKKFREDFTARELTREFLAVILIAVGLIFLLK